MEIIHVGQEELRAITNAAKRRRTPLMALLEVNASCNLRCKHCFLQDFSAYQKQLTLSEIKSVLRQLARAGVFELRISGGEPFLHKDIIEIIRYARSLDFSCTIITNGTLITEEIAERLAKFALREIRVSLYGWDRKTFGMVTGKPELFDHAVSGIKCLLKNKIPVSVRTWFFRENTPKDDIGTAELFKRLGLPYGVPALQVFPTRKGGTSHLKHHITRRQFQYFCQKEPELCHLRRGRPFIQDDLVCEKPMIYVSVFSDGSLGVCQYVISKANIRNGKLIELWRKDRLFNKIRKLKYKDLAHCNKCHYTFYCTPCPGLAHIASGRLAGKPPKEFCAVARWRSEINAARIMKETNHAALCTPGKD